MKICILGTAYPFRGGLAAYNERLARQLEVEGHEVQLLTFTLQYPSFLFPGKTQFSDGTPPVDMDIQRCIHSINPFNWLRVGRRLRREKPDLLIIKYWMPFMAPCFGTIARIVKGNRHTQVISIVDNMIPHEQHFYDKALSRYFVGAVDAFVAMSRSVQNDVRLFAPQKKCALSPHPMFDNFGQALSREEALQKLGLDPQQHYLLFFGFIRHYKGLDWLIEAFADERLRGLPLQLIIAGEFYEDAKPYKDLIEKYSLEDRVVLKTEFIPDAEVAPFFCGSDILVLPYKDATQSGVTQIAYHFLTPMLVTDVGGLAELIPDGRAGFVVAPRVDAIADALVDFYQNHKRKAIQESLQEERKRFQWDRMTQTLYELMNLDTYDCKK